MTGLSVGDVVYFPGATLSTNTDRPYTVVSVDPLRVTCPGVWKGTNGPYEITPEEAEALGMTRDQPHT